VDVACGPSGGRGRFFYNGMHVSPTRGATGGTFPGSCALATGLTEAEKALEFHIFQLTQCQLGGSPPPPPPVPLVPITYSRDYQAICPVGTRVKWAPFYWESDVPATTSIKFQAATSDNPATLPVVPPAGPVPGPPITANVGTSTPPGTAAPAWACTGCPPTPVSVDSQLLADTATPSGIYLRVFITFNPNGSASPTLLSWRQVYDCVPAE
jgi:hypothetical protein